MVLRPRWTEFIEPDGPVIVPYEEDVCPALGTGGGATEAGFTVVFDSRRARGSTSTSRPARPPSGAVSASQVNGRALSVDVSEFDFPVAYVADGHRQFLPDIGEASVVMKGQYADLGRERKESDNVMSAGQGDGEAGGVSVRDDPF